MPDSLENVIDPQPIPTRQSFLVRVEFTDPKAVVDPSAVPPIYRSPVDLVAQAFDDGAAVAVFDRTTVDTSDPKALKVTSGGQPLNVDLEGNDEDLARAIDAARDAFAYIYRRKLALGVPVQRGIALRAAP